MLTYCISYIVCTLNLMANILVEHSTESTILLLAVCINTGECI